MRERRTGRDPDRRWVAWAGSALLVLGLAAGRLRADQVARAQASAPAPADAEVLFDGATAEGWQHRDGSPCRWRVADGSMEVVPGTGDVVSKRFFGDFQLHLEFATPYQPEAKGQGRGNSGVYFHGLYEVQILDSYGIEEYDSADCGGIYGVAKAMVNACLPPERWQSYDILFRAPRFDAAGKLERRARVSVLQNGIWIHDGVELPGPTVAAMPRTPTGSGPIMLQDHGNRVRFRNIWVRPLGPGGA